jgi:streptomycin 6-kinase
VKLNRQGSDKDKSLLVKTIISALRKFMKPVPNQRSMLLTLSIQFISASSGKKLQRLLFVAGYNVGIAQRVVANNRMVAPNC